MFTPKKLIPKHLPKVTENILGRKREVISKLPDLSPPGLHPGVEIVQGLDQQVTRLIA